MNRYDYDREEYYYNDEYISLIAGILEKDEVEINDIVELSLVTTEDVPEALFDDAWDCFYNIMDKYATEWDDYDSKYPNNPYHEGYKLDGYVFVTNYTGLAGRYWDNPYNDSYIRHITRP